MKLKTLLLSLALPALACGHGAALASAKSAHAEITNIQLKLVDLTPGDGVAAGYTLNRYNGYATTSSSSRLYGPTNYQYLSYAETGSFDLPSTSAGAKADAFGTGAANLHSTVELNSTTQGASARSDVTSYYYGTLKAHSAITFTGSFGGGVTADATDNGYLFFLGSVNLSVYTIGGSGDCWNVYHTFNWSEGQGNGIAPQSFSCTYRNNTDTDADLSLSWSASTQAFRDGPNVPVPEPSTYLMFGAGMLMLGVVARRRNLRG